MARVRIPIVGHLTRKWVPGTLAMVGIMAKLGLFVWVNHTSDWTVGTSTLSGITVILGLLIMVLALVDFGRSRGHWVPLTAFVLGLVTFAPVIAYPV